MPALVAGIHALLCDKGRRGWPGQAHARPARILLEKVHGIDSASVQWIANHLNMKRTNAVPHQNIVFHGLLKQIPWATFDQLVEEHGAEPDDRGIKSRAHLIAMLLAQVCGARGLREIETTLKSHAAKLYHLGGGTISTFITALNYAVQHGAKAAFDWQADSQRVNLQQGRPGAHRRVSPRSKRRSPRMLKATTTTTMHMPAASAGIG